MQIQFYQGFDGVGWASETASKILCYLSVDVKVWNSLPPTVVSFTILSLFKNSLNKINFHLCTKYYYLVTIVLFGLIYILSI